MQIDESLREELEKRGVSFRSTSDTEVLLKSYETWGKKGEAEKYRELLILQK